MLNNKRKCVIHEIIYVNDHRSYIYNLSSSEN